MGWWFGRKNAAPDMRPFVPAWLSTAGEEEGFARSSEGMNAYVRSAGLWAVHSVRGWELGPLHCSSLCVEGQQVVGARSKPIAAPSGGSTLDKEARSALNQVLQALRRHGLIEM